jgi:formyltetrahydrofolate deformylase
MRVTGHVSQSEIVLALTCPDQPGIVHAVSGFFLERGGDIIDSQQFGSRASGRFFMRVHVGLDGPSADVDALRSDFGTIAREYRMEWSLTDIEELPRVAILVSRFGHCLNDLLYRWSTGQLRVDIRLIVSNHRDFELLAESYDVPFVHVPVTPDTKREAEQELMSLVKEHAIDLVVLARYMQVLSDELCEQLAGRAINIHHSFLPSFKGGRPYHQAFERGVKLVGATAHYVTAELDEGPIIEQEVVRVHHGFGAQDLTVAGRDAECVALARAVQWHAENRVLLDGPRTVVLR